MKLLLTFRSSAFLGTLLSSGLIGLTPFLAPLPAAAQTGGRPAAQNGSSQSPAPTSAPVADATVTEQISLRDVEQRAANNRTIAVLEKAAAAALAELDRVNVRPNPTLSAQLGNTLGGRYGLRDTDRLIRIEQLVERGNKRGLRADNARALITMARQEVLAASREQRQAASQTYFDLALAQGQVALLLENLLNYERLLSGVNRRLLAGDVAAVDVSRLKVEASRAANELRLGQAQVLKASIELSQKINKDSETSALRAKDTLPGLNDIEDAVALALRDLSQRKALAAEQRADLRAAQARIEAAEKNLELARSLRTRDISVGLQAERSPATDGTIFALSASVPLFVYNDFRGDISKAQAELEQAQLDKSRISLSVQNEIDQASAQLISTRDRTLRLLRDALPNAKQAAEAIEFAFLKGAGTLTDLFDARRQYNSIRQEAEAAKAELAKALALLRLSTWVETP